MKIYGQKINIRDTNAILSWLGVEVCRASLTLSNAVEQDLVWVTTKIDFFSIIIYPHALWFAG